ncbi:unnamed protein product, partial [Brenthis ino]
MTLRHFKSPLDLSKNWKRQDNKPKFYKGETSLLRHSHSSKGIQSKNSRLTNIYTILEVHVVSVRVGASREATSPVEAHIKKKEASPCHRCGQIHRVSCPAIGVIWQLMQETKPFFKVCHTIKKVNALSQSDSDVEIFVKSNFVV